MINDIDRVIAHRGLHNDEVPENSLLAFKNAINKGYAIELDVQLLKDGTIIVIHDYNLKRLTGIDKMVKDTTYAELKNFNIKDSNEKIPTLDEVLNLVNGKVLLDIELKVTNNDYKLEEALLKRLSDYKGNFILKSFNYKTVKYLKKYSNYYVGLLLSNYKKEKNLITRYKIKITQSSFFINYVKPDFIACEFTMLPLLSISKYRNKGHQIYAWTIKNIDDYNNIKNYCDKFIMEKII